ncbi:ABC transporter ATP-binding protein [Evansella sp. AB-rgal1]|uniref:ABC transporter ATP-binding protein n=1 Tax=Evansella sp. AB-rgal1 TaxID=3242696 RepID=UPI00359EC594
MFVEIENLKYKYPTSNELTIKDFSLQMEKGEIVAILGESGSGKSTLLKLIAGKEKTKVGKIVIDGDVVVDKKTCKSPKKRGIGIVFQEHDLAANKTVEGNIKRTLPLLMAKNAKEDRVEEMLDLVDLYIFRDRFPKELSGGQQQRVTLAKALAPEPSLILFDDPFRNLDPSTQKNLREELRAILKKAGITSIFVSNNKADAKVLADRVLFMEDGEIKQTCKPEEVYNVNL